MQVFFIGIIKIEMFLYIIIKVKDKLNTNEFQQ
jgi:hypothetical protein